MQIAPPPSDPGERFALIIEGLCKLIFSQHGRFDSALLTVIYNRFSRLGRRFSRLALLIRAGQSPAGMPARARSLAEPSARTADPVKAAAPRINVPTRHAWLLRMIPYKAAAFGSQLQFLLSDPEMQKLIAAAPERMGRMLRPLCKALAVDARLLLPPAPRRVRAKPAVALDSGPAGPLAAERPQPASPRAPRLSKRPRRLSREELGFVRIPCTFPIRSA